MHPVTPLLPLSYLWLPKLPSSLFPFLASFLSPSQLSLFHHTTHTIGQFTPSTMSQANPVAPLDSTYPSNSAEWEKCLSCETYTPMDRTEGEYQTVTVCVSVQPHPHQHHLPPPSGGPSHADKSNESGCTLRQWQKVWSLKCSHSLTSFCQESLCVINNTNEAYFTVFNLWYWDIDMVRWSNGISLSTEKRRKDYRK